MGCKIKMALNRHECGILFITNTHLIMEHLFTLMIINACIIMSQTPNFSCFNDVITSDVKSFGTM